MVEMGKALRIDSLGGISFGSAWLGGVINYSEKRLLGVSASN